LERSKNALAAARAIGSADTRAKRAIVISLYKRSAMPRQSKPGPRFDVLAGTRTVTCCIWNCAEDNCFALLHKMRMSEWIDTARVQVFADEQTDAYRLCTFDDGWV